MATYGYDGRWALEYLILLAYEAGDAVSGEGAGVLCDGLPHSNNLFDADDAKDKILRSQLQ